MMMRDLSMHVLDIAQNSISAGAKLIEIRVLADSEKDTLLISVKDDGCGMDEAMAKAVLDPFVTSRSTRKVGLGIPMFKVGAEATGGSFTLNSAPGEGTSMVAVYTLSHLDRSPLGDMAQTIHTLIFCNPELDFVFGFALDASAFECDTRELREVLGEVKFNEPEVSAWLGEYLREGVDEATGGKTL